MYVRYVRHRAAQSVGGGADRGPRTFGQRSPSQLYSPPAAGVPHRCRKDTMSSNSQIAAYSVHRSRTNNGRLRLVASSKKLYNTQKECADAIGTTPPRIKNACNRGGGIIIHTTFFVMYDSDDLEPGAMTPYFHRITKWFVQHAHARPEFAPYSDLKAQFEAAMDAVENDIDRVSFSDAFPESERGWNSIKPPRRVEAVGKTYYQLMVRWARSPAFGGRGESFADYPVSKLGSIANLDHMTNRPGEAKSGRSVSTCACSGLYPVVIEEAIQTEAVLIFDNASGKQNIAKFQLRREASRYEEEEPYQPAVRGGSAKFQLRREASRYEEEEGLVDDAGEAGDSAADEVNGEISDDSGNSGFMEESPPRQGSKRSTADRTPASGQRSSKRRGSAQS